MRVFDAPLPRDKKILLGVGGLKESGKDAFVNVLHDEYMFYRRGWSDILDEILLATNPWVRTERGEPGYRHPPMNANVPDFQTYQTIRVKFSYGTAKKIRNVRELLQRLGTEAGRTLISPQVWVDLAIKSAGRLSLEMLESLNVRGAAITGVRYPEELAFIREHGGIALWIDRPEITAKHEAALAAQDSTATHSSEVTLGPEDFDMVVRNDGTLAELHEFVHRWAALVGVA